jgi:hypothetical protein
MGFIKERFTGIIKTIVPDPIVKPIQKFRDRRRLEGSLKRFKGQTLEDTFNTIYREGVWGEGSGPGSEGAWADGYVEFVRRFIDENKIKSITDVGCGDFRVGAKIIDIVEAYNAADVSDLIIERNKKTFDLNNVKFMKLNACIDDIPRADLVTIRQVLQHLTNAEIELILANVEKSGTKFCIIAEHLPAVKEFIRPNIDLPTHSFGVRSWIGSGVMIDQPPFSRPANLGAIIDDPLTRGRLSIFVYSIQ